MTSLDWRIRLFAASLSLLAGFADALAFVELGGFFVSFMSGNSTRLAVGLSDHPSHAALAAALIAGFVGGVTVGSLLSAATKRRKMTAVLALVATLLALAAAMSAVGLRWLAIAAMALAMGAENAIFERDGEVRFGLTYMTGSLVKLGQGLAGAVMGRRRPFWPHLLLWLAFVAGAVLGATIHSLTGLSGLWYAAGYAGFLAVISATLRTNSAS